MDWLFRKLFGDTLPDDEMIRWLFAAYTWLLRYRGGYAEFKRSRRLVLPLDDVFPITTSDKSKIADEVFEHVKRYARMEDWNCRLLMHNDEEMSSRLAEQSENDEGTENFNAAGTFSMAWDQSDTTITYSPSQLSDRMSLVATFAHELSHFYLATVPFDPPKGPVAEEYATDVCAVSMGFGIFLANTSKRYYRGAVSGQQGYLGEIALSFALAIFTELRDVPENTVRPHLKSNPRSYFSSALSDIRKRWVPEIKALRRVEAHDN